MPASPQDKVLVPCPRCGHRQSEARVAFSTVCRKCGQHIRVQEALQPARPAPANGPPRKRVTCFECGADLEVPATAESTMCKRCSRYVDLKDYHIISAISKNFKTRGSFVIEQKGYVFNSETIAGDAVVKGRFLGKLSAERSLTIHSTAEIKGSISAGQLVIPAGHHFRWKEPLKLGSAEIAGELVADLALQGTLLLRSTAHLFGNVEARHFKVEEGAVVVGEMRVGVKR